MPTTQSHGASTETSRADLLERIEGFVLSFLTILSEGEIPCIKFPAARGTGDNDNEDSDDDDSLGGDDGDDDASGGGNDSDGDRSSTTPRPQNRRSASLAITFLPEEVGKKRKHPSKAAYTRALLACRRYVGLLVVLSYSADLLRGGCTIRQRECYYANATFFRNQRQCNRAIADLCVLFGESRHALGFEASPRGFWTGRLRTRLRGDANWNDPCAGAAQEVAAVVITSRWMVPDMEVESDALFILVVEKECTFHRLRKARFFDLLKCIIITGQGFPPLAVRAMVHSLHHVLRLPVLGLTDCNPFGLALFLTYRHGSANPAAGRMPGRYRVPTIKWIGVRPSQLGHLDLPAAALQPLKPVDAAKARALLRSDAVVGGVAALAAEVACWTTDFGRKVEMEALAGADAGGGGGGGGGSGRGGGGGGGGVGGSVGFGSDRLGEEKLVRWLEQRILQRDFI